MYHQKNAGSDLQNIAPYAQLGKINLSIYIWFI